MRKSIAFFTLVMVASVGKTHADFIWWPENGHYYKLTDKPMFWHEAEAHAVSLGGHLASILSMEEQQFINTTFLSEPYVDPSGALWIGLSEKRQEGVWEWTTGEPFEFSYWNPNEPNNWTMDEDYVIINWSALKLGGWNDIDKFGSGGRGYKHFGIMEFQAIPEPSTPALLITGVVILLLLRRRQLVPLYRQTFGS